jgi:hypothetical protein
LIILNPDGSAAKREIPSQTADKNLENKQTYIMRLKLFVPLAVLGLAITLLASAAISKRPVTPADENTTEANITRVTTSLLEHSQFSHHPLDDELAGKFLDGYLDALDGAHDLFLQSDVAEFDRLSCDLGANHPSHWRNPHGAGNF